MIQKTVLNNSKRVAKNTLMLYFRQILIMLVSLYTVRAVLSTLGAVDYGIYNVVAGVVSAFSFLSGAMATASQRYFSYYIGTENYDNLQKTFCVTLEIYILLSFIVVLIAETIGLWFVTNKLVVPEERRVAVIFIYQSAIFSFIFTLITTPYVSLIISYEKMDAFAYVSIAEVILKLFIVFLLRIIFMDKLILYGLLLCCVSLIITSLYRFYCRKHFKKCHFKFQWDFEMFKEMISYSGWNLFGSMSDIVKNQGLNILLNLFFGPIINASRGIAMQVSIAVNSFAQNFSLSVRPQIIKKYAMNEETSLMNWVYISSKATFLLLYVFALPLILEMNYVLTLWLKNVPDNTIIFTILVLLEALITSLSLPMMSLIQATGRIKWYQIIVGGLIILNLPTSFIILKILPDPLIVFFINILIAIIALFARLVIIKKEVKFFSISQFLLKVVLPISIVSILSFSMTFGVTKLIADSFLRLMLVICVSSISIFTFSLLIGLNKEERDFILNIIKGKLKWKK